MSSVRLCLLKQLGSCFRHVPVELFEVFDLPEQADENGVEVDLEQSIFLVLVALVVGDEEVFEFFVSVLIDFLFPQSDLGLFVILDNLQNVLVEFIDILVFFPFGDALAERVDLLEGF